MTHSLVPMPTISPPTNLSPAPGSKKNASLIPTPQSNKARSHFHLRREFTYSLVACGLASLVTVENANAARRPPPPPPPAGEKKDPSITGVRAKVLASMKRKEAMKEEIAKLREKGKPVN